MLVLSKKGDVYVGASGGVDSSTVAFLLKEAGYGVHLVYLRQWYDIAEGNCPYKEDIEYVERLAKYLNVDYAVWDKRAEYKKEVLDYFLIEYKAGRTPNPDVLCNNRFKFKVFLSEALYRGANFIATGHYAILGGTGFAKLGIEKTGLYTGVDVRKDQSYFLHRLGVDQIEASIMPLGWLLKSEVRALAKWGGLPQADRPDSQGICFLGDIDIMEFLSKHLGERVGPIIDMDTNEVVGKHRGVWFYTIGQRSGLGIGGVSKPYYVVQKDIERNILYVVMGRDHPNLYKKRIKIKDLYFIDFIDKKYTTQTIYAVIRYHGEVRKVSFIDRYTLEVLDSPGFWGVSPGQFIVFYKNDPRKAYLTLEGGHNTISPKRLFKMLINTPEELLKMRLNMVRPAKVLGGAIIHE